MVAKCMYSAVEDFRECLVVYRTIANKVRVSSKAKSLLKTMFKKQIPGYVRNRSVYFLLFIVVTVGCKNNKRLG